MGLFIVPYIIIFSPILLPMYIYERFKYSVEESFGYIKGVLTGWEEDL